MIIFTYLADFITYQIFKLIPETKLADAVHFFIEDVTKIFFLLFIISFAISFLRSYLSPAKIRTYLENKPRWIQGILAALLGAITPFCSCSSIPLFIGFVEAGIPFGTTMTFLITSPLINEIAIVILGASIGWKFTVIYVATGIILGLIGGFVIEKLKLEKYIESHVYETKIRKIKERKLSFKENLDYASYYCKDLISKIWIYIIIGIAIGAGLHGYVPTSFFTDNLGKTNLFAVPLAVIVGIPLYSNATGIIPIAEVLLAKGLPVGTVFAMMMSVVAISLPELIILRQVMKVKLLAYFVGILFILIVFVGYFYNFIF